MVDRDGGSGPRTELDLDAQAKAAVEAARGEIRESKPTELDLNAAAAAAVDAAREAAGVIEVARLEGPAEPPKRIAQGTPAVEQHQTLIGAPAETGTPPPKKARVSVFAPTAAASAESIESLRLPIAVESDPDGTGQVELSGGLAPLEPFEELPEGTLLVGRYHIKELVGQGGMGAVYAAHDDDLDEDIALKVLRPDLARDTDFQKRLKAEVRLARRVSHPNVCRVHDLGVDDGLVFVTMELVRGHTLRERLAAIHAGREEPFELAQIVDIIMQVGSALSAAHRAGVIHRDVKPDNVILSAGRAVLTDFGVASMAIDRSRQVVGTPAYLAPEVLRGEAFDHRVDVYAVACVAYELIAGSPPYVARTIDAALQLAQRAPVYPALPGAFATPAVRSALDRVLARGLAADPAQRAATIERFTDGFAHAARGAPLSLGLRGSSRADRISTQEGSTPIPVVRRTELRVTTALVWTANRGTRDTEEAERIVVDAGGTPIRIATGEIAALFGASRSTGDDADRAAHAALALVAKFGGRVGLDTTRILLRPTDTELAGPDSASKAASLAHHAREGEVWATQVTARQLAARFEILASDGEARRVTGVRPVRGGELAYESLRGSEVQTICRHLERSFHERKPVFVEVRGTAGSGKTRLRKAVVAAIAARREVEWLIAVTSPAGEPAPLSVVQNCNRDWYDVTTAGGFGDVARRDVAARRWLEMRAMHRPVVVIAEDLQWADPSSRTLLDHLRGALLNVPVAIVTFVRATDNDTPPPAGVEGVWLGPLDNTRSILLARSIAPDASDDDIADLVMRAAGNPFFIEELARDLATGSPHPTASTLPTTIEAVVQAHLDQLPDAAAQVAIAAAVIGHGFWRRALARLVPALGEAQLDAALGELEAAGMITSATATIVEDEYYQFTSNLVRDVAYTRIPARERRQAHAAVAGWLDDQARRIEHDASRLLAIAHHREHAGDAARAATAYRQAGLHCLELFAYGEATAALRKAVALITVPDPVLEEALADALAQTEGYAAAEPFYQRALDETDDEDGPARARLYEKLGAAAAKRGMASNAIARYKAGLAIAAPGGRLAPWSDADPRTAAQLWAGLGWTIGYVLGQVEEGHPYCERAVAVLERTQYRRELAHALSRLGGTYMRACRFSDQLVCNQRNLEIGIELRDLQMQLTANVNLGVVHGLLGELDRAVAATEAARDLAARMDAQSSAGLAASNLAGLYLEQRRLDDADRMLDDAIAIIERTGNRYVLCESLVFRARIAAARGDLKAALDHAGKSLALARSLGNPLDAAIALRVVAQIEARSGQIDAARTRIEEAFVQAVVHDEFEGIRTRAARARILAIAGDPTAAGELDDLRYELGRLGTRRELAVLADLDEVR